MVAPDDPFVVIPATDGDPEKPVTSTLIKAMIGNDKHLEQWLGDAFVAAKDHRHDNIDSMAIALAALITIEKFSGIGATDTGTGTTSFNTGALLDVPRMAWVKGFQVDTNINTEGIFDGMITGTSGGAESLAIRDDGTVNTYDANAAGGVPASAPSTHGVDLDVDNFQQTAPGIQFEASAAPGIGNTRTWELTVVILEFS